MHLGLARTALLGWLRARSLGGAFVVRIEDLDAPRTVSGASERLLEDLCFLGLDWDEGPDVGGPFAPYLQSQRLERYAEALDALARRGRLYSCSCSRKEIAIASAPHGPSEFGPPYPGTCRASPQRADVPCAQRFLAPAALPHFRDGLLGEVAPLALGDFVLQRADGTVSYQLAVVVDDAAMEISEVLRGEDLAGCTGWQLALYEALGWPAPAFVHVPLLRGPDGARLAKREDARNPETPRSAREQSVAALRAAGVDAAQIVGALAGSVGLVAPGARTLPGELVAAFSLDRVRERQLDWERALG